MSVSSSEELELPRLTSLSVNGGITLYPDFDPAVTEYSVIVPGDDMPVEVECAAEGPGIGRSIVQTTLI